MADTIKQLEWTVNLDGSDRTSITLSADVTLDAFGDGSSATVTVASLPGGLDVGDSVQVYAGFDGDTGIIFNGEIFDIKWDLESSFPQLICGDKMARLQFPWGNETRTYNNDGIDDPDTDNSTVQNLVEASGIDSGDTSIEGQDWEIGTVESIVLENGDIPLELIRKIDEATAPTYVTFSRRDGSIYRRPIVIGSSSATYSQGTHIYSADRVKTKRGIKNSIKVTGRATFGVPVEATAQASSSYIPSPFEFVTEPITNDIIQDPTAAQDMADAHLTRKNILKDETNITVVGDYTANPATTITITASRLGLSSALRWVPVVRHSVSAADFTTTLTCITIGS